MRQRLARARVVVVSENDANTIYGCLDEVAAQCPPGVDVLVVDCDSSDGSPELAIQHPRTDRVAVVRPGSVDRVIAVATQEARRLVVLRADMRPEPGWLASGIAALDRAALVFGPDRNLGNMALDLSHLRQLRLFRGAESVDEVRRRADAARVCTSVAPDMRVLPALASPPPGGSLPVMPAPGGHASQDIGRITVVVCTKDRPAPLERCLRSLSRLEDEDHEILVVDNHRRPTVDPGALPDGARVVHEPRPGVDAARNRGIAEATGEIVAYIDDDCEADPHWLNGLRRAFADPEVGFVTGRVRAASLATRSQRQFEAHFTFDRGLIPRRFTPWDDRPWYPLWTGPIGTGCNMAFRRRELLAVGAFDEILDVGTSIGGGGDLDMFARLLDRRVIAEYAPDALVWHHHRADPRQLTEQFRGYGQAAGAVLMKAVMERPGSRLAAIRCYNDRLMTRLRVARAIRQGSELVSMRLLVNDLVGYLTGPLLYLRARWGPQRG